LLPYSASSTIAKADESERAIYEAVTSTRRIEAHLVGHWLLRRQPLSESLLIAVVGSVL
jgi:hypothetical protein